MKIAIDNAALIGKIVCDSRKTQKIRQDDAAGSIGVSGNFLGKVERGSQILRNCSLWIKFSGRFGMEQIV